MLDTDSVLLGENPVHVSVVFQVQLGVEFLCDICIILVKQASLWVTAKQQRISTFSCVCF